MSSRSAVRTASERESTTPSATSESISRARSSSIRVTSWLILCSIASGIAKRNALFGRGRSSLLRSLRVGELQIGARLLEGAHDRVLHPPLPQNRLERAERLDRETCLLEISGLGRDAA